MKYIVILGDGMADYPIEELHGKTPLEAAKKPNMDALAEVSETGLCRTVPQNMKPGSDVANLSVLGYDPAVLYGAFPPRSGEYRHSLKGNGRNVPRKPGYPVGSGKF